MRLPFNLNLKWLPVAGAVLLATAGAGALAAGCDAQSGQMIAPVIELYTSQGCSSCPPADRWLSALRSDGAGADRPVIQAFHVAYWDYIGWTDPFAHTAHTQRQRQIAQWNQLRSIYTPQVVANGRDWRNWHQAGTSVPRAAQRSAVTITLRQRDKDAFEATVAFDEPVVPAWAAYWTVTENAHQTSVRAGENSGELLRNDHVVRQYTPAGTYRSAPTAPQTLVLHTIPASPGHARTVNLVVFDPRNGKTLQALASAC